MEHFANSFLLSMLHSLWQAALLFIAARIFFFLNKGQTPLSKRNFLLYLLAGQFALTTATFYITYNNTVPAFEKLIPGNLTIFFENSFLQSWSAFGFLIYTSIITIRSLYLYLSWKKFRTGYKSGMQKAPLHLRLFTASKALEFGIYQQVIIWCSEKITTPVTYGFLKPVILMPVALVNQLTIAEAETLIIHELTHIKNNDFLWNIFVIIAETIYFFNPFLFLMTKHLKQEREKTCDVQVIHYKYAPLLYAEALLKTAKTRQASLSLQLGAIRNTNELLSRIHFFSDHLNFNFRRPNRILPLLFVPLLLLLNFFMVMQVANKDSLQQPAPTDIKFASFQKSAEIPVAVFTEALSETQSEVIQPEEKIIAASPTLSPVIEAREDAHSPNKIVGKESFETVVDEVPMAITVSHDMPGAKETKEVLIQETNSAGDKITIALQAELKNGQWVMQPIWMLSETKNKVDSLNTGKDSVLRPILSVQ